MGVAHEQFLLGDAQALAAMGPVDCLRLRGELGPVLREALFLLPGLRQFHGVGDDFDSTNHGPSWAHFSTCCSMSCWLLA